MTSAPSTIGIATTWNDQELDRHIIEFSRAADRDIKDVARQQMKLFIQGSGNIPGLFDITPPAYRGNTGPAAKKAGEHAIMRDLGAVFVPVTIKGFRTITTVFGRKIANPVRVQTTEKWPDVPAIYHERSGRRHGGRLTRGRKQAYYVSRSKLTSLANSLKAKVGTLAAGWIPAALELEAKVPAFIMRHAGRARGTIQISYDKGILIRAVNHFPDGADQLAADTQRRIEAVKGYRIAAIKRQLEAKLKGLWGKR
jgi:hypothetical protein